MFSCSDLFSLCKDSVKYLTNLCRQSTGQTRYWSFAAGLTQLRCTPILTNYSQNQLTNFASRVICYLFLNVNVAQVTIILRNSVIHICCQKSGQKNAQIYKSICDVINVMANVLHCQCFDFFS